MQFSFVATQNNSFHINRDNELENAFLTNAFSLFFVKNIMFWSLF